VRMFGQVRSKCSGDSGDLLLKRQMSDMERANLCRYVLEGKWSERNRLMEVTEERSSSLYQFFHCMGLYWTEWSVCLCYDVIQFFRVL